MEFSDRLSAISRKVQDQAGAIGTEEATKNAFIMPFISSILGYDVFDPLEVVPEFTATRSCVTVRFRSSLNASHREAC